VGKVNALHIVSTRFLILVAAITAVILTAECLGGIVISGFGHARRSSLLARRNRTRGRLGDRYRRENAGALVGDLALLAVVHAAPLVRRTGLLGLLARVRRSSVTVCSLV
jgi:hypothetical protein